MEASFGSLSLNNPVLFDEQIPLFNELEPLLRTNRIPSEEENSLIERWYSSFRRPLHTLEHEISSLKRQLEVLESRYSQAKAAQLIFTPATSIVRRLPVDVLQEIFHQVPFGERIYDSNEGPWILCRVCKPWRAVALSDTRLWARANLLVDDLSGIPEPTPSVRVSKQKYLWGTAAFLLTTILNRTGTRGFGFRHTIRVQSLPYDILGLLLRRSSQWTHVDFMLEHPGCSERIQSVHSHLPILRELTFSILEKDNFMEIPRVIAFAECPRLNTLNLDDSGPIEPFPLTRLALPYSQVQHCTYSNINQPCSKATASILIIFTLLRHLISFEATSLSGRGVHFIQVPVTRLIAASLTTLATSNLHVLSSLQLPRLTSLTVFAVHRYEPPTEEDENLEDLNVGRDILPVVISLLTASRCSLTHLALTDSYFSLPDVEQLFELTPDLSELSIEFRFFGQANLRQESVRALVRSIGQEATGQEDAMDLDQGLDNPPYETQPTSQRFRFIPALKKIFFSDERVGQSDPEQYFFERLLHIARQRRVNDDGFFEEIQISLSPLNPHVPFQDATGARLWDLIIRLKNAGVRVSIEGDFMKRERQQYAP